MNVDRFTVYLRKIQQTFPLNALQTRGIFLWMKPDFNRSMPRFRAFEITTW